MKLLFAFATHPLRRRVAADADIYYFDGLADAYRRVAFIADTRS